MESAPLCFKVQLTRQGVLGPKTLKVPYIATGRSHTLGIQVVARAHGAVSRLAGQPAAGASNRTLVPCHGGDRQNRRGRRLSRKLRMWRRHAASETAPFGPLDVFAA